MPDAPADSARADGVIADPQPRGRRPLPAATPFDIVRITPCVQPLGTVAMPKPPRTSRSRVVAAESLGRYALESRERLKQAARQLINRHGYTSLRIEDIAAKARLAKGLFYRYFKNRYHITLELCRDVFTDIERESSGVLPDLHPFEWFTRHAMTATRPFCENPGLLACMFELHGEFPEISRAWKETSRRWNRRLASYLEERGGISRQSSEDMAFVLAATMEGIIYQDLVRNVNDLRALGKRPEQIAEIIAIVWYRTVYLELPPASAVRFESRLLHSISLPGAGR